MLERIHRGKTGALFSAAATAGALIAGAPRRRDRLARGVRQEPRAGVPDHRRPARRRRRSGARPARPCARTRRRRRSCRSAAWPARGSSPPSCARPPIARWRRSAGAPTGCASCRRSSRRGAGSAWRPRPDPRHSATSTSSASSCARSATSMRASTASCSGRRTRRGARRRLRCWRACASARSPRVLLGPAAAIGVAARCPARHRRRATRSSWRSTSGCSSARRASLATSGAGRCRPPQPAPGPALSDDAPHALAAGAVVTIACLAYLTLWWDASTLAAGPSAGVPAWTLLPVAVAAAISLLLGHLVTVTTLAVVVARSGGAGGVHGVPGFVAPRAALAAGRCRFVARAAPAHLQRASGSRARRSAAARRRVERRPGRG